MMVHSRIRARSRGFSLLEVILALLLSVFVVAGIAAAIRLNVLTLEQQRTRIERTQVARSVLQVIARDLRAALQYKPADVSGLEEIMAGTNASAAAGADPSLLGEYAEGLGIDDTGAIPGGDPAATSASEDSGIIPIHPGLYGSETHLVIDVSRLPRIDEYAPQFLGDGFKSIPSDAKTIVYYVENSKDENTVSFTMEDEVELGGLIRRSSDRAVASYAYAAGADLLSFGHQELIAPEIAEIRFRYFDGTDWVTSWDSDQANGFPSAVEVSIVIDPRKIEAQYQSDYVYNGFDQTSMEIYRTVVYLPVAEILPEEEEEPEPAAPAAEGGGEGSGTNQDDGGDR